MIKCFLKGKNNLCTKQVRRFFFFGDIMNAEVKIKSKMFLRGNTVRLFLISLFSFFVRRGIFALWGYCLIALFKSGILSFYLENYNDAFVYTVVVFDVFFVTAIIFLFICALKLGEQFLYFIKASGGKGRTGLLFHFFTFKGSFRALSLYLKLTVLKVAWLLFFLLPSVVCYGITYYLYSSGGISAPVFYILITGSSLLLSLCIFMWRITFSRYNAAPYYVCLNRDITPKEAIKKSIHFTDGVLRESVLLESSFFGWFLSCITVVPFVYVLPYFKISKALFVIDALSFRAYPKLKSKYAINFLSLK